MTFGDLFSGDDSGDEPLDPGAVFDGDPGLEAGVVAGDSHSGDAAPHVDGISDGVSEQSEAAVSPGDDVRFGYSGSFGGVSNCWYSSDGYVYDAAGNRIGTH
ncbi:MAG: hypothetical protein AB1941_15095 [Gemmatimonadota bacterium]